MAYSCSYTTIVLDGSRAMRRLGLQSLRIGDKLAAPNFFPSSALHGEGWSQPYAKVCLAELLCTSYLGEATFKRLHFCSTKKWFI